MYVTFFQTLDHMLPAPPLKRRETPPPTSHCFLLWHVNCDPDLIYQPNSEVPAGSLGAPGQHHYLIRLQDRLQAGASLAPILSRLHMQSHEGMLNPEAFIWSPGGHRSSGLSLPPTLCQSAWKWKSTETAIFHPRGATSLLKQAWPCSHSEVTVSKYHGKLCRFLFFHFSTV